MAMHSSLKGGTFVPSNPKKTRQGRSVHTKLSATSSRPKKKRYRGQGK